MSFENLEDHRRLTHESLHLLRSLRKHSDGLALPEVSTRLAEVIGRVEGDVFRIAVVGEFKRGKSTLINALLGQEILPADVLPCSATLNRVTYGLQPRVELVFRPDASGVRRKEEIAADKLAEYVTKLTPDSEKRASDIEEAIVYHPVRFCRDKADIIDTPGLNDDQAMTQVTMGVLPQVDAALFVILAQSPFSGYEGDFLNKLLTEDLGRVIFVVNRIDEIRKEGDKQRILDVVRARIEKGVRARAAELHGEGTPDAEALIRRIGKPRVFGVSGADALDGRLNNDDALVERSGFPAFEASLERFLAIERGVVTLLIVADSALAATRKVLAQASIRRGALGMKAEQFEAAYATTTTDLERMRGELRTELERLDRASRHLRDTLRPRARELPHILLREANAAVDAFPLTDTDVSKANSGETVKLMSRAVLDRVQGAARLESERLQVEIEKGLQDEIAKLVDFGARMEKSLAEIELRFQPPAGGEGLSEGITTGASVLITGFGGWLVGGVVGGAFSGYQVAGLKGAAAGAAVGVVTGFGALLASGLVIGALGLPLTWPVMIPALLISGLASSFGARRFTRMLFGGDQVKVFRDKFREAIVGQLEQDSAARVAEVEKAVDEQITGVFTTLRTRVQADLGGVVEQTKRTLDDLRTQRTRSVAQAEQESADLDELVREVSAIDTRMREVSTNLRSLDVS